MMDEEEEFDETKIPSLLSDGDEDEFGEEEEPEEDPLSMGFHEVGGEPEPETDF